MKRRYWGSIISLAVLCIVLLLLSFTIPFPVHAFEPDLEKELQQSLIQSRAVINRADKKLKDSLPLDNEITKLKEVAESVKITNALIQERFRLRREQVNSLGAKAQERHRIMEEGYQRTLEEYLALMENLQRDSGHPAALSNQLKNLKTLHDKILPKKKRPIFGNLPYKNLNYPAREPNASPVIIPSYRGGNQAAFPDDTKSTPEAPISPEIATLAQSLSWNPVSIYEYMKDNIETEWYWGCMKGAEETLRQKSGNDCDQAALLTALLRSSGFPTRYVRGVIEFPYLGHVKNLTGIDDAAKIADFFQKAGIPHKSIISAGTISNFQIEHVWIESLIPYSNYRGAIIDEHGKTWLGLDTSIKVTGYTYNAPLDILQELSLGGLRDGYLDTVRTETPLEYTKAYIETYLNQNHPGMTYSDLLQTKSLIPEVMNILPASMQYDQKKITHEYTEIPDDLKQQVRFTASDTNNNELFAITIDALKLSNKQATISYEPETIEDQQIIDSYGGLDNTPAYLVRLRPVLKVNEEREVVGKDGLPMGADYELSIELISPNAVERTTNIHITGNVAAIGIVAQRAISSELSAISEEDSAETILYKEANRYIDRWNQAEDELASLMHLEVTRPIPTVVTVGGVIDVTYLLDMPHGFEWKGVFVDASLRATSTVASHDSKVTSERQKTFMRLSALQGSILENKIFEDDFQVDSVSTAELLQLAATTQQEVVMIDKTNIASLLPTLSVDDNVREDISNSVNQGLIVRIPRIDITHQDWSGIGYIKENPSTGEAGYMLSGMIAGGMTTMMPEEWVEYRLVSTLKAPFTGEPSKGPAATIVKVLPTDRQSGIVGTQLGQQLMVLVQDRQGLPVEGAKVTFRVIAGGGNFGKNLLQQPQETLEVKTGKDGVARARFLLGTKTSDNPMYTKIDAQDEFVTQIGLNLVTATTGSIVIQQPFNLYGTPDAPFEIKKIYGDGAVGLANNPAGSLVAKVVDKYGNPISNQSIRMKTVGINPRYAGTALPPQPKPLEFYDRKTCTNPYPLYGDCASSPEVTVTTQYYGAIATAVFGDTVATRYSVEASVVNSGLLPTYFELYTSGFRAIDNYIPPGVYLRYLQPVNDSGQPINASRAGTPLKGPLSAEFVLMRDDVKLEGPTSCSSGEGSCWNLVTTGKVITEKITNGTVNFSATAGGGTAGATENLHNGKYRAPYTTGPSPSVNLVEAGGTATITVPKVLYNPMVTGTVIPSFGADYSGSTKPLAIKEYRDTSLQCSNGTCKLPEASITLKGGQQVIFYAAEPMQQATGSEQKATYTLFGVDVPVVIEPKVMFLNEKGYSYADTKIKYTILPPEYNASIVDLDIFKDGAWQGYLVGGASQGSDSATITAGSVLDVNSNYTVQAVLNRGSDVEITSSEIALPIGQFRMVADDDGITPMEGAVTDGAARLRLQLIAKHNREAFSNLIWRVYDSQLKNDPIANSNTVRGTLVDGSNNPTEALYVTFNADGIAEAVYRAPATFVRWGTSQESNDKDIPERQIQPTLDLTDSLLADGEMLPAIKLKRPPVVLVHGLWGNAKAWDEFEPKLNDRSQYSIARVDYSESGQVSSIVKHAAKLRTTINTKLTDLIREGFASSKIDIIAHSMGGLLTREFCKQQKERFNNDCNDVIRRFITIATPHRGSELADLLLVYRGPNTRDFFSTNQDCLRTLDSFERGSKIRVIGPYERSVEPHPLTPKDGAIDDLATGALPPQLPQGLTSKGRWKDYPALSQTLSAHTIVGLTGANADGYDIEIFGLWRYIISRCGFTRVAIFGAEAETNDRIVKQTSQIGGVIDQHSTKVYDTDHFSVRNSIKTIDRIRELIDEPRDSELFTK